MPMSRLMWAERANTTEQLTPARGCTIQVRLCGIKSASKLFQASVDKKLWGNQCDILIVITRNEENLCILEEAFSNFNAKL